MAQAWWHGAVFYEIYVRRLCRLQQRRDRRPVAGRLLAASDPLVRLVSARLTLPPSSAAWLDASVR